MRDRMVVIGLGRMGQRFADLFSPRFDVTSLRASTLLADSEVADSSAVEHLSRASFVFVAVPVDALSTCVQPILRWTPESAVVLNCCAAQRAATRMLGATERRNVSLLPESRAIAPGERIDVVGSLPDTIAEHLIDRGYALAETTADAHDATLAPLGLAHFLALALGAELSDDDRAMLSGAPAGRRMLQLVDHVASNSLTTYQEQQLHNSFIASRRSALVRVLQSLDATLAAGQCPAAWGGSARIDKAHPG
jgi:prephenate dehydrogenase